MPSAIAIRMYCVNLLDIINPPCSRQVRVWHILTQAQPASLACQFRTQIVILRSRALARRLEGWPRVPGPSSRLAARCGERLRMTWRRLLDRGVNVLVVQRTPTD